MMNNDMMMKDNDMMMKDDDMMMFSLLEQYNFYLRKSRF